MLRAVLLVALFATASVADATDGYPHVALYWFLHGDGRPLLDPVTGALVTEVADAVSRYQQLVIDIDPIAPYRPDVLDSLRRRNPDLRILGFVTGQCIWPPNSADSLRDFPTVYWRTVRDLDGFLYNRAGEPYGYRNFAFADVNLAKRDVSGRYVVAEAVAQVMYDAAFTQASWDGLFLDTYCDRIAWSQSPVESIDFVRAGYPNAASFDLAWNAGTEALANRLRALLGPDAILVGNCGPGTKYGTFNGWMRENFPHQNGGTWASNMFNDPGGYFVDDARFRAPTNNYILSIAYPPDTAYAAENTRRVRYALASAALGDGYACFDVTGRVVDEHPYGLWWYDEYAVDLATGVSSVDARHTGWLGQPLAPWYQTFWLAYVPDAVTNPGGEEGLEGWSLTHADTLPAELVRDTLSSAVGSASLHVRVGRGALADSLVCLANSQTTSLLAGGRYSVTFWACASVRRGIDVVAGVPGGVVLARGSVTIDTQWRQYHVALQPYPSGSARLQFHMGRVPGDVWLDEIHFQPGINMVYRRDFEHGTVLVNPNALFAWVPLGRAFQRIMGTADPVVNDGSTVYFATVPANDALFLIDPLTTLSVSGIGLTPRPAKLVLAPHPSQDGVMRMTFDLPEPGRVTLELYDTQGRLRARRALGALPGGHHEDSWHPGSLRPGVYFVQLQMADKRVTTRWVVPR